MKSGPRESPSRARQKGRKRSGSGGRASKQEGGWSGLVSYKGGEEGSQISDRNETSCGGKEGMGQKTG